MSDQNMNKKVIYTTHGKKKRLCTMINVNGKIVFGYEEGTEVIGYMTFDELLMALMRLKPKNINNLRLYSSGC